MCFGKSSVHFEPYFRSRRLNLSGKFGKTTFPLNLLDKFVKFKSPSTKNGERVGKFRKSWKRRWRIVFRLVYFARGCR